VTQADILVQNELVEKISGRYPGMDFIYEENYTCSPDAGMKPGRMTAIIDPIDGTAMYSMYLPVWCISVGIFLGEQPLYGFVYSPGFDMLYYNDNDAAYLNGRRLSADREMRIDSETNLFYSSEMRPGTVINFPGKIRNIGSTALHACLTTDNRRNRVLAFIGKSFLWDWAGAIPIIGKAGGNLRYINGGEIDYRAILENGCRMRDYLVAYNTDDFTLIRKIFSNF